MSISIEEILNSHRTGRAIVAGILNVTPDSFSDGGDFLSSKDATQQAMQMADDGAEIIDVGAESTRPGSARVSPNEQIQRLKDILPALSQIDAVVSIDTTSSKVARFAIDCGAAIINDVSAGRDDPEIFKLTAHSGAAIILMHMLGEPKTMQEKPEYEDVVVQVGDFLAKRIEAAQKAGVAKEKVIIDPGIGFGKKLEHNLALLAGTKELLKLGCPIMIGASRKRFIGEISGQYEPNQRIPGTIAACLAAWRRGASIFRVHDVEQFTQALKVAQSIENAV